MDNLNLTWLDTHPNNLSRSVPVPFKGCAGTEHLPLTYDLGLLCQLQSYEPLLDTLSPPLTLSSAEL